MIVLIAAMSENRAIGRDGGMPWHLPDDLRRFKALTTGHTVIMGRRTFDELGGRPLRDRRNIVITRNRDLAGPGVVVVHDLDEALAASGETAEAYVIGGGEIYRLAMPRADRLELTVVHAEVDGDVTFPEFDEREWRLVLDERHEPDERHFAAFSFRRWERETR